MPTVSEALKSKEALLVQFATEKRLGIQATRNLLQTVAPQTLLRNAVKSDPLPLDEVSTSAYHEYERWLRALTSRFGFDSRSRLLDVVSRRPRHTKLKNVMPVRSQQTYGFGLEASQGRDPWLEITVGCAREALKLVASLKEEAVRCAQSRLSSDVFSRDEDLQQYVDLRLRQEGVIGDIAKPVARILCLAMSANPQNAALTCATWPDDRSRQGWKAQEWAIGGSTWRSIIETIIREVRCWEGRGIPVLIVLDCALGWPEKMAEVIKSHEAGAALGWEMTGFGDSKDGRLNPGVFLARSEQVEEEEEVRWYRGGGQTREEAHWREERNEFFRRYTETHVRSCLKDKPFGYGPHGLDAGANKSARTAHLALRLLHELRCELHKKLPVLTISCGPITQSSVIEVTTVEAKWLVRKHAEGVDPGSVDEVSEKECRVRLMLEAATAFLYGRLETPSDAEVPDDVARKEGWIWSTARKRR